MHASTWMDYENIMLSDINQTQKDIHDSTYIRHLEQADS